MQSAMAAFFRVCGYLLENGIGQHKEKQKDKMSNNIKGLTIAAMIVPTSSADTFATHDEQYGKGGYRTVATLSERNEITQDRLKEGMVVYVENGDTESACTHEYRLASNINGNKVWEHTDKYDLMSSVISSLPNYSAITEAKTVLGYNTIDTWQKAIDVLFYAVSSITGGTTPTPPTPSVYVFNVNCNEPQAITDNTEGEFTFNITSTKDGNAQPYSVAVVGDCVASSGWTASPTPTLYVSAATDGNFDVIFTQEESMTNITEPFTVTLPTQDAGYYMMMIENYTTGWTAWDEHYEPIYVTSDEATAISQVMDDYSLTDYAETVPSLSAISRISALENSPFTSGPFSISYFEEYADKGVTKVDDMCTDEYDVYVITNSTINGFYFLLDDSLADKANNALVTTQFTNGKPDFDDSLATSSLVKLQDSDPSDIFKNDAIYQNLISSNVEAKHRQGLTNCNVYVKSGFAAGINIGIKIPKRQVE